MAPVISRMSAAESEAVLSSLLKQQPSLQVDMITASAAVGGGENFMSDVMAVEVDAHNRISGEPVNLRYVMKRLPESVERRAIFQCDAAYQNEAVFYNTVLPSLEAAGKDLRGQLPFPSCLLAADDLIILSHLGQEGYVMVDRRRGLDLQHCLLVIQELAKFHAISYAMKHNTPSLLADISSMTREWSISKDNPILDACVDNSVNMALTVAKDLHSPAALRLRSVIGRGYQALSPLVAPAEPLAVLCHGDLWSNNLLFRYSSDTPQDVRFLDLQGCRYASPALDILYFLFTSSAPGVLHQHFNHLISAYHLLLQDHLGLISPSAPMITLEDIYSEIRHYADFGLVMSLMVLPVVTAQDVVVDLDDVSVESLTSQDCQEKFQKGLINDGFKRRVNEVLDIFSSECVP